MYITNPGKKVWLLSFATLSTLGTTPSFSQSTEVQEKSGIEEVVVTAQRRAESAQDIPVALSAFKDSDIENFNVVAFNDITKISPAITIGESNAKMFTTIYLRGIGTYSLGAGVEPSVSVVVDGVPVVQQAQAFSNLNDIERIEVLKGPQGTLFGKNASAGLINIITKGPSDEFEASIEQTATTDDEYVTKLSVSGPITDNLGYRVNGYLRDFDGYLDDIALNKTFGTDNSKAFRGKLKWDVSEKLTLDVIADYSKSETTPAPPTWRTFNPSTQALFIPDIKIGPKNLESRGDVAPEDNTESHKFSAALNYDLAEHTLTSMTAVSNWKSSNRADSDSTDFNFAALFGIPNVVAGISNIESNEVDQIFQELRITSPSSDTFEYMAGLYFEKAETERSLDRFLILDIHWTGVIESESKAIFGQVKWGLGDSTFLTLGSRYNWVTLDVEYDDKKLGDFYQGSVSDDALQGKVSLQHNLNDDLMLFASYSRGYKGPGYDVTSGFDQSFVDNPVGKETSDSYEIGMKGSFFDNRAQLNIVIFDTIFSDFQAQTQFVDFANGINDLKLSNVGELETKGVEIESTLLLFENFLLNLNIAYTDAVINEFPGATCYPLQTADQGCVNGSQDLSGVDLSNSPDWKYTISGEYTLPFNRFTGFANFTYTWQDEVNFQLTADPTTVQDSYGVLNVSTGIEVEDSYKVTLFVNNVFDQEYAGTISGALGGLVGGPSTIQLTTRWERYAGIKFKLIF